MATPSSSDSRSLESYDALQSASRVPNVLIRVICTTWHKIQDIVTSMLRALGLAIVTHTFRSLGFFKKLGSHEPVKTAIRKNRVIALLRSLIHLIPVSVAFCEIVLNWNAYYVGVFIYNQATYQLLAKVHELTIQASLAAVIFSYMRHEMIIGNGIPFGALLSGLQISQIAYLWSMEFWGTIRTPHLRFRRKLALLVLIFTCIVVATLAGPSSAVLLIPRSNFWPAGNTDIWLNATTDDLYPAFLDQAIVPDGCFSAPEQALSNACPSSEWEAIRTFIALTSHSIPEKARQAYGGAIGPEYLWLSGKNSQRQQYAVRSADYDPHVTPYGSTTQTVAVADALATTAYLWFMGLENVTAKSGHGAPESYQSDSVHVLGGQSFQSYVLGICVDDTIHNDTDTRPVAFPELHKASDPSTVNTNITMSDNFTIGGIMHPGISRAEIVTASGDPLHYRLQWVDLPQPLFNGTSMGAVFLPPQTGNSSSPKQWPQKIHMCNFAAGWGKTTLQMHVDESNVDTSVASKVAVNVDDPNPDLRSALKSQNANDEFNWNHPQYPNRLINMTQAWAQYLSPVVQSANRSVIDLIMQERFILRGPESHLQVSHSATSALVMMLSNGLARVGFDSTVQGYPKSKLSSDGVPWIDGNYWLSGKSNVFEVDPDQRQDWVRLHVDSNIEGYAYNTATVASRLAIAVLVTYCIVALAHVFYAGITGISSTSWDSIAEVTGLAMNSTPTKALHNTCAGITRLHTFRLPVRVFALPNKDNDGEHLELVFGEEGKFGDSVKANTKYGTRHSSE